MIDGQAIGEAQAYLLEHRMVETKPVGRKISSRERAVADTLMGMDYDATTFFNDMLSAQGFMLEHFSYTDMRGIPIKGRVWLLVRDPHQTCPSYISSRQVIEGLSLNAEPIESSSVWFLHIWLIYMTVTYTNTKRVVTEVSGYLDANFTKEQLVKAVSEHVEKIRGITVEGGINQKVFSILDSEKGKDIPKRVTRFLKALERSKLIRETESDSYEQTLLGAFEIANSYPRTLGNLIDDDSTLDNVGNIGTDGMAKDSTGEEGENNVVN